MKFARISFWIAGIWGFLILAPLYFIFDTIGKNDPRPITHPAFYYGFAGVALVWQVAFIMIARDPVRLRPMIIPAALEKFVWGATVLVLYLQHRLHGTDLALGAIDSCLGVLFLLAFLRTSASGTST